LEDVESSFVNGSHVRALSGAMRIGGLTAKVIHRESVHDDAIGMAGGRVVRHRGKGGG
jgi:hypothetical protein